MNQQKVWNRIASEWHEFKRTPSKAATKFLNQSQGKIIDFGSGSGRNLLELTPQAYTKKVRVYLKGTRPLRQAGLKDGPESKECFTRCKKSAKREIYLVDFSKEMLRLAKQRAKDLGLKVKTEVSRLEKTPFEDNFFDAGICTAALHCIETHANREKAIKELFRILKPGAKVEVEVWNKNSERFKKKPKEKFVAWRDKGKRYYYFYDEEEIHDLFKKIGFKIMKTMPHRANIIFIAEKLKR